MIFTSDTLTRLTSLLLAGILLSCTSIIVRPFESRAQMNHVCIKHNPKVLVDDFVPVVRDGLSRHGVSSEEFSGDTPSYCEFILTYTALRSWDFAPYLSHPEIRVERNGLQVGYGEFHLRGKGGYSMFKWPSTKTKMDPVIDQLFTN